MSHHGPDAPSRVGRGHLVRYVLGVGVGVVVLVALVSQRGDLVAARHRLTHPNAVWALAAVVAEFASVLSYAYLQRRVLRVAGTTVGLSALLAISLANNAIANTVPAEPVISSAFRFREYRRRGADAASSAWTILTIIITQAVGLCLVLLTGVVTSLAGGAHANLTGVALVGLVVVLVAGAVLVRPDRLLGLVSSLVRPARDERAPRRREFARRVTTTLQRMGEMRLGPRATVGVCALATLTWLLDAACLLCAFAAVHAPIPRRGVLLAYGVAQIVAVLPLTPGGLGLVEGSLTVILVAEGASRGGALSAVLVYRLVNFWLAVAVGWLAFAFLSRGARRTTHH